jgi:amino acid transporter
VGLPALVPVLAALITLGALGGASAWLAATARLMFVTGVDRYLPPVFARLHPRWRTPVAALVAQGVGVAVFVALGQAGVSVKSAYDFLLSMGVITYFVPYFVMFAALIRLQREPLPPDALRIPGGRGVTMAHAVVGMTTIAVSIVLAIFPPGQGGAGAFKVLAATIVVMAMGGALYVHARRRTA